MSLYFITGSVNKFAEAKAIVPELQQLKIDLPEIQELDPKIIIQKKLEVAFKHSHGEFVVEDTSLYFDCLAGKLPGPLIKWFLQSQGLEGTSNLAIKMGGTGATVQTILGYAKSAKEIYYFEGSLRGNIVVPRGKSEFGFDPIFEIETTGKTFAEMTK